MLHILFNPGPLAVIIDTSGRLLDAQDRIEGDPTDRTLSRLIRRGSLIDLGPVPEPEFE